MVIDDAGRVLLLGFPGDRITPDLAPVLRDLSPGGIILFRRNLSHPDVLATLLAEVRACLPEDPLLALDQEGGRVSRLEPWIGPTPSAARLAEAGPGAAHRFGRATARALGALGFNVDFAPVVDLCPPGATNGIGDRSFGTDPRAAATLAGAFLDGLQEGGVAGCLKHFPGLGDTAVDSHAVRPRVTRTADRLREEDLLPYRELSGRAACVMVGHGSYPALDPVDRPACLSPAVVTGLLRGELGFGGLVVTDDLEMGAVIADDRDGSGAVAAIAAGCDLLLYCHTPARAEAAVRAMEREAATSPAFAARLAEAAARVRATARRWPARATDAAAFAAARREIEEASA